MFSAHVFGNNLEQGLDYGGMGPVRLVKKPQYSIILFRNLFWGNKLWPVIYHSFFMIIRHRVSTQVYVFFESKPGIYKIIVFSQRYLFHHCRFANTRMTHYL